MRFLVALILPALLAAQDPSPTVEQLIERLRSPNVDERSRAELLLALREGESLPALERATKDPDAEVSTRARRLLETIPLLQTLTPALKRAMPTLRERLASGTPHAWTEAFLEATKQDGSRRAHPELDRDDFLPLAHAAATAMTRDECAAVCGAVAAWQLAPAGPALARWLDEPDWEVRRFVLDAVQWSGDRSLEPLLLERCRSNRDLLWSLWAGLLARMGNREILPEILAALAAQDQNRRAGPELYPALVRAGAVDAAPLLLRALRQDYWGSQLLPVLEQLVPDEIQPSLLENLRSPDRQTRSAALHLLTSVRVTPELLPEYRKLLENPADRVHGLTGIGNLRRRDLLPEIRTYLEDPAVDVRGAAASILACFGDKSGLPELILALRNADQAVGPIYTIRALGAREAIPDLLPLLDVPKLRAHALDVLGALGAREIRPRVLEALKDADPDVRRNAAVALTNLDGRAAIPLLLPLLDDPDFNMSHNTAPQMLDYLKAKEALPIYRKKFLEAERLVGSTMLYHMAAVAPEESLPDLIAALDSPDRFNRMTAVEHLGRTHRTEVAPKLRVLLRDREDVVRRAAATALAWLGEAAGVPLILQDPAYQGTLFELNVVRKPEVCRAWRGNTLAGPDLRGSNREKLEELCRRSGIELQVSPHVVWPVHSEELAVEGRDLLSVVAGLVWGTGGGVVEDGRLRILAPVEARPFWVRWWAGELAKSGRAEDRKAAEELERGVAEGERRRAERKKALAAEEPPKPEQLAALLTPFLKNVPGLEERLAHGRDEEWTRAFTAASQSNREFEGIKNADFEALAPRAILGAVTVPEITSIYQVGCYRKLSTLRPGATAHLKHSSPDVRIAAARLLLILDGPKALRETLPLLSDDDPRTRQGIVNVFGDLGVVEAAPYVRSRLDDPAVKAALPGAAAGLEMEEGLAPLLELMKRGPREMLAFQLIPLGDPSFGEKVRDLLRTENHPNAVQTEIGMLSSWGCKAAVPDLVALIEKPRQFSEMYQGETFRALVALGAREAAPTILARLRPEKFSVQAAEAAGRLGLPEAVPPLRAALAVPARAALPQVAVALGLLGDRDSIPPIRKLLSHEKPETRGGAAYALALLDDRESFATIVDNAKTENGLNHGTRDALCLIRTPESRLVLAKNIYYSSPQFTAAVSPGGPDVIEALRRFLSHQDVWTRWGAVLALGHIEGDGVTAELRRMMNEDEFDAVRQAAAAMLCRRGLREGVLLVWQHSRERFQPLPFDLNGVRSPAAWSKLRAATLREPYEGSVLDLLRKVAAATGLAFDDLPADSRERPALENVQVRILKAELPVSGLEAIERLSQYRWTIVLEPDRLRVLPRKEATAFWREWYAKEKR